MGKLKGILAAGAGAKKTLKSADVDAFGQFKGKIQNAIDEIDNPKGGFEADVIPKAKKKPKKKKKLTAEQQKLKELEDANKGAAEDISKTDDEIAIEIAEKDLGLGGNLYDQQDFMVKVEKKLTKRGENALKRKKAAKAERARKKAIKDAKKKDPSLSSKGIREGTSISTPNSVTVAERNRQKIIKDRNKNK